MICEHVSSMNVGLFEGFVTQLKWKIESYGLKESRNCSMKKFWDENVSIYRVSGLMKHLNCPKLGVGEGKEKSS